MRKVVYPKTKRKKEKKEKRERSERELGRMS